MIHVAMGDEAQIADLIGTEGSALADPGVQPRPSGGDHSFQIALIRSLLASSSADALRLEKRKRNSS